MEGVVAGVEEGDDEGVDVLETSLQPGVGISLYWIRWTRVAAATENGITMSLMS